MWILVVRHGLAGKRDSRKFPEDDLRPLTPKGRKSFAKAARGLAAPAALGGKGRSPETVFASPVLRALETARILAKAVPLGRESVIPVPALHHARPARAGLAALARLHPPSAFAVVGHEPNLGEIVSLLISGTAGAGTPLEKGSACLIEADALAPGAGRLVWSMTQDQLAALGRS